MTMHTAPIAAQKMLRARRHNANVNPAVAVKSSQVGAVCIAIDLGQEQACCDSSSRFVGMLNGHDSLEDGAMVDVRQVREFERFRREHGGVKHHIVILDAGHVQRCVIRSGLDSDIALSPPDHPEIFLRNPAANFGVASRRMV